MKRTSKEAIGKQYPKNTEKQQRASLYKHSLATRTHQFEQIYHENRPNIINLINDIKTGMLRTPLYIIRSTQEELWIAIRFNGNYQDIVFCKIYLGNSRFKLQSERTATRRPIYRYIQHGIEYVQDANGIFVRRYVKRNMSQHDQPQECGFVSRDGRMPHGSDINQTIMRHLRAAQQGGSYFISFTTTMNPIFGATGKNFHMPKYGQAIVDLAKIPQEDIYDVHAIKAVDKIITTNPLNWELQYKEGDPIYEANATARDTIRTREVLIIHGDVRRNAVVAFYPEKKHTTFKYNQGWQYHGSGLI